MNLGAISGYAAYPVTARMMMIGMKVLNIFSHCKLRESCVKRLLIIIFKGGVYREKRDIFYLTSALREYSSDSEKQGGFDP